MTETPAGAQAEPGRYRRVASPLHTAVVLAAIGVQVYRGAIHADQMRAAVNPNRIGMYERTIFVEWLMFGFVILGVWLSGSPLAAVLGDRWRSAREVARDIGIGAAFMVVAVMVGSIIGSHVHGADGNSAAQFLLPRGRLEIALWIVVSVTAGICEEAVYRGYLQRQFIALTKNAPAGILLSAAAFGGAHAYQGLRQAVQIGVLGAMAGLLAYWRRSVRPGMIAHALQDTLAVFVRH
jgi:membrane protease YdiL (CAAX protease family)